MKRVAIVGSRKMSLYGKRVIELIMREIAGKAEVSTIEVSGCNREVIRQGARKIFRGDNFEKLNNDLANYADLLVVIEGGEGSGTLLAAKCFLDLGKEVWAVPGRIDDPNSKMSNYLIKNGATPLIEPADLTGSLQ